MDPGRSLYAAQAGWYLGSGLWSLLLPRHYRRVHEVERDWWVEKTHAVFLTLIGATLGAAAARGTDPGEARVLGAGAAGGLAVVDALAARRQGLARIYLVDLTGEAIFTLAWLRRLAGR